MKRQKNYNNSLEPTRYQRKIYRSELRGTCLPTGKIKSSLWLLKSKVISFSFIMAIVFLSACEKMSLEPETNTFRNGEAHSILALRTWSSENIDSIITNHFNTHTVFGLDVGIRDKGVFYGFQRGNKAPGIALTPFVQTDWGSTTKTFTAALILKLAEQGKLCPDTGDSQSNGCPSNPLERKLSAFQIGNGVNGASSISIRNMLQMTSGLRCPLNGGILGIPDLVFFDARCACRSRGDMASWTLDYVINRYKSMTPVFPAGTMGEYINTNYIYSAKIAEEVTGKAYNQLLNDEILNPIGVSASTFMQLPNQNYTWAHGMWADISDSQPLSWYDKRGCLGPWVNSGSGGLISTASDMTKLIKALFEARIVSPASLQLMKTPTLVPARWAFTEPLSTYGMGMAVKLDSIGNVKYYYHQGGAAGFTAAWMYIPATQIVVAFNFTSQVKDWPIGSPLIGDPEDVELMEKLYAALSNTKVVTPNNM